MINMIACISNNRGLGYKGELLFNIPEDLKLFNLMTCGGIVVMGKTTWDSLPAKPLSHRINVVLSSNTATGVYDGVYFFQTEDELRHFIAQNIEDDIWIIGGQSLYEMFIEEADKVILTEVDAEPKADRFFPMFDCGEYAKLTLMHGEYQGHKWQTNIYQDLEHWKQNLPTNLVDEPKC